MIANTYSPKNSRSTFIKDILIKTIISILLCFGVNVLFAFEPLLAQQNERQITPLSEDDYACLQQLSCVIESKELRDKGWMVTLDEPLYRQESIARMKGDNIKLTARYDKDGNLMRGMYERKNVALPRVLLSHLAGEDYSGWEMTANNLTVRDFNFKSTRYNIVLESEQGKKEVSFTHVDIINMSTGNNVNLAESH